MKEKNLSKKNLTSNVQPLTTSRGITLIALVITIIVMLILVSVTIGIAVNGGLFDYAGKAVGETKNAINSEQQFIDQIVLGDYEGNYNQEKHVNKPKLSEGMIPIKYNGSNWEICSEEDKEWYDYSEDKMQWANVMLSDGKYKTTNNTATIGTKVADADLGSMFVWVPRYAYSINEYGIVKNDEGKTQKITNVTFLVGTTNKDITGKEYTLDYDAGNAESNKGKPTPSIVHPAFNFGGKSLTGLWVAKFEASMEGQTNANTSDTTTGDDITTKNVKVLPNAQSWRYIRIGNMFTNCLNMNKDGNIYGINNTVDSHLMKNGEWGAVAYLAVSQYGITPTKNLNYKLTDGKYEGYTGGGDGTSGNSYKDKLTQSTTGNVTGIYDMCGGACEYVAAYYDNRNGNIGTYGTSAYFEGNTLNAEYEKYWDRYEVDEGEINPNASWRNDNETIRSLAEKRLNLMKDVKGIGMYDVKDTFSFYGKLPSGDWTWMTSIDDTSTKYGTCIYNGDHTLVGNISLSFLLRGGSWYYGSYDGVFAFYGYGGYASNDVRLPSSTCSILIWNFLGRTL